MKLLIASLAVALTAQVYAATDYRVVVPVPGRATAAPIRVSLSSATLPAAQAGSTYGGYDFKSNLSVSGDAGFNGSGVTWSVSSGSLPAGLVLNGDGTLTGTPTASANTYNFALSAQYKGANGTGSYSLAVKSAASATFAPIPPATTVFPLTGVNDYSYQLFSLTNTGSVPMTIQSMAPALGSGATFVLGASGRPVTSLAPGAQARFTVKFQPTAPGPFSGTVTVTTAEAGSFVVAVTGQAANELPPVLDKSGLSFGDVAFNTTSAPQVVTITNVSSTPMQITGMTITPQSGPSIGLFNPLLANGTCYQGSWVAVGGSCSLVIVYTPIVYGPAAHQLTITTPGGQKVIPLTGNGV